jgi:hypothetical protein
VEDRVDVLQRPVDRPPIPDVPLDQLHVGGEVLGPLAVLAMNLRHQGVQRAHPVPPREQLVGQVRADEARSPGDQYPLLRHPVP